MLPQIAELSNLFLGVQADKEEEGSSKQTRF